MEVCSNCYSGCVEIVSDKCIRYTGMENPVLGILNGDSQSYVNATLICAVETTLNGTGIKYELDPDRTCSLITDKLVDCTDVTVIEITNALSEAICELEGLITTNTSAIATIEADYTTTCLSGVDGTEGTHDVLQATIDKLCTIETELDALALDLSTNYVSIEDIDTYIENYLVESGNVGNEQYRKMIPYVAVEYYGSLSYFDATGAGTGDWINIYLCNGNNGTPDKRGRIPVGTTTGMGGGAFPSATDPLVSGNPTYLLYSTTGSNTVTLTETQIPSHTHTASLSTDGQHTHDLVYPVPGYNGGSDDDNRLTNTDNISSVDIDETEPAGDHTHTVTVDATGGGQSHNNIPPVLACHYIIYIPSA